MSYCQLNLEASSCRFAAPFAEQRGHVSYTSFPDLLPEFNEGTVNRCPETSP
jgi:hypothetical protein